MQKERIFDFITIYGWAILVILVAVGSLIYFGIIEPKTKENQDYVCNNLEKIVDSNLVVYPAIIQRKMELENEWNFRVVHIDGKTVKARQWDDDGVMCEMEAELCEPNYTFCFDIDFIVPVEYEEWEIWYKGVKNANPNKA